MFSFDDYDRLIRHIEQLKRGAQVCRKLETPDQYQVELTKEGSFTGYDLKAKRVGDGLALAVQNDDDGYYKEFVFPHGDPDRIHWENLGNKLTLIVPKRKHPLHLLHQMVTDNHELNQNSAWMRYLEDGGDEDLWDEAERMVSAIQLAEDIEDEDEAYVNRKYMQPLNNMVTAIDTAEEIEDEDDRYERQVKQRQQQQLQSLKSQPKNGGAQNGKQKLVDRSKLQALDLLARAYRLVEQLDSNHRLSDAEKMLKALEIAEQLEDQIDLLENERLATAYETANKIKNENERYQNMKYMKPLNDMVTAEDVAEDIDRENERYLRAKQQRQQQPRHQQLRPQPPKPQLKPQIRPQPQQRSLQQQLKPRPKPKPAALASKPANPAPSLPTPKPKHVQVEEVPDEEFLFKKAL